MNQKRGFPNFRSGRGGLWSELQLRFAVQETSLSIIFKMKEVTERLPVCCRSQSTDFGPLRKFLQCKNPTNYGPWQRDYQDGCHTQIHFLLLLYLEIFCLTPEEFSVNTLSKQATWHAWSSQNLISSHISRHKSIGLSGWNRREADE